MIPFPRLHFFSPHFIQSNPDPKKNLLRPETFASDLFDPRTCFLDLKPSYGGRTLTYYAGVRATKKMLMSEKIVHDSLMRYQKSKEQYFLKWIPENR
jgi:hypothetical protein